MRPTNCYEPFHRNGEGHVRGGAEGHRRHGVEDVDVHMGEEHGFSKKCGIGMDGDFEKDVH